MEQVIVSGSTELERVVKESGLQLNEAAEIKGNYLPFLVEFEKIRNQAQSIDTVNPTEADERFSRELRLKTVKIRTAAEAKKEERKRIHLLRGNLEQASFNIVKSTCQLAEESFLQVEKVRENKEAERKAALKSERLELLAPFNFQFDNGFHLDEMSQDAFDNLLAGVKKVHEDRIEQERKAQEERIAREKADAEERERVRIENERLNKEAIEREAILLEERRAANKIQAQQELKLKAEREAKERAESELKAKQLAEETAKKEADKLARKLARQPDKAKLILLAKELEMYTLPDFKSAEAQHIADGVKVLMKKVSDFITSKAAEL